jgi:hypothetical protein
MSYSGNAVFYWQSDIQVMVENTYGKAFVYAAFEPIILYFYAFSFVIQLSM